MSDLLIKNLELPKEDRIQLSVYPNGKVINHSSFTDTTLLSVELPPQDNYWHTGTPTEEGWYLCERKKYEYRKYFVYCFKNGKWDYFLPENILRWQKIE